MRFRSLHFSWLLVLILLSGAISPAFAARATRAAITRNPATQTVEWGERATFSVSFKTTSTAKFQWRRNGTAIKGATSSKYVINNVKTGHAGTYDVLITNAGGTVASRRAALIVPLAPASLPKGMALHADLTYRMLGSTFPTDGAYVVTGKKTMIDPEDDDASIYTFTYKRTSLNTATLTMSGYFYDEDLGESVTLAETRALVFKKIHSNGIRLSASTSKGTFTLPRYYSPSRVAFTSTGTISLEPASSSSSGSAGVTATSPNFHESSAITIVAAPSN